MNQDLSKNSKGLNYLKKASVYEVNLRQYTAEGNFISFHQHLPRLKKMGVTIIWLMPIFPIGEKNRKGSMGSCYAISDFFQVNPEFGNIEDFKKLVEAIHRLEMKVIIDWVANHVAWDHPWTISQPNFFQKDQLGNFFSPFDWSDVIQIDHDNPEAHRAMCDAMCFWVREFDIDGFRADMAHLTPLSFWRRVKIKAETIKSSLIWLAETDNKEYYEVFDMVYTWRWMHETETFFKNPHRRASELLEILKRQEMELSPEGLGLFYTSNHDENSWNGTEFEKYGIYHKGLAAWSFFYSRSIPLIYGGQETPNKKRLLFFDKDELDWSSKMEYFLFYQQMMQYRKSLDLSDGLNWLDYSSQVFGFKRGNEDSAIVFLFNISETVAALKLENYLINKNYRVVYFEGDASAYSNSSIMLLPGDFILLEMTK